jgi:hypothetical protein
MFIKMIYDHKQLDQWYILTMPPITRRTTRMNSRPLPPEMKAFIFEHLEQKTLAVVVRASKDFKILATPFLYQHITIDYAWLWRLHKTWADNDGPELSRYVKSLTLIDKTQLLARPYSPAATQ